MKIILIQPVSKNSKRPLLLNFFKINSSPIKPLVFPILAALTPKKHTVEVIERKPKDIDFNKEVDLVGISSMTPEAMSAYEIADEFRKQDVKVVLGGWHPSATPEEAKQHADSVVIGEGEEIWPQLLNDFENKNLKPFYRQDRPVDVNNFPRPDLSIYPKGTNVGILATRGCPNKCKFCSIASQIHRKKYRMRPIENVIQEIQQNSNNPLSFQDNSLTINLNYTKKLFKEMAKIDKKFYAYGNIDMLGRDDELLKLASEGGCICWVVGFESVNQESLDSVGKRTNIVDNYISSIKKVHDYGIEIMGSFVFGFDADTIDTFRQTDDFIAKSEIDYPYCNILTPFPGSQLFNKYEEEGRILTKDWSKYNLKNVVFEPKNMTTEQLLKHTQKSHKKWYRVHNIIKRASQNSDLGVTTLLSKISTNYYWKYETNI